MNGRPARVGVELVLGVLFLVLGAFVLGMLLFYEDPAPPRGGQLVILGLCVLLLFALGALFTSIGVGKWRRVGYLSEHGIQLFARVVNIEGTNVRLGHVPVYLLTVEAAGPSGQVRADVRKALHAHEASSIIGKELRILVDPKRPSDAILDEETQL